MGSEQRYGAYKWNGDETTTTYTDITHFKEQTVIPAQCEEVLKDAKIQIQTSSTKVEYLNLEKEKRRLSNSAFKVCHHLQLKILTTQKFYGHC